MNSTIIERLKEARENLLSINKDQLTGQELLAWYEKWKSTLKQSDVMFCGDSVDINVLYKLGPFKNELNTDVCMDLRKNFVNLIDDKILTINNSEVVKSILEDQISKVKDTKLSTLLLEFNAIKDTQPNMAASGFRTILPLIIRERAKIASPAHKLAVKDDIAFEPDINEAVKSSELFNEAEKKLIKRYLNGGNKDSFDNIVHKPDYLIQKDDLNDAVDLLNKILPTITA